MNWWAAYGAAEPHPRSLLPCRGEPNLVLLPKLGDAGSRLLALPIWISGFLHTELYLTNRSAFSA